MIGQNKDSSTGTHSISKIERLAGRRPERYLAATSVRDGNSPKVAE